METIVGKLIAKIEPFIYWVGVVVGMLLLSLNMSCATVLAGGPPTPYQTNRPGPGEPQREVRVGALVADLFLVGPIAVAIDFATGHIYKPAPSTSKSATKLTKAERREQWDRKRTYLLAKKQWQKIRKFEGRDGFSFEELQKIDSLERVMAENAPTPRRTPETGGR